MTINEAVRRLATRLLHPLAVTLVAWGVPPNALTLVGCLLTASVGVLLAQGRFLLGGVLIVLTTLFDGLDGLVARVSGRTSRFGAFLDSTSDRYAEAALLFGLLLYYIHQQRDVEVILLFVVLVGSFMVSYTRARAEGLDIECKEGVLTRFERLAILVLGLISGQVRLALWVLAVLANVTALQRVWVVWQKTDRGRV